VRRLDTAEAGSDLRDLSHRAVDVNRFADLGTEWFWEDVFQLPEPTYWSKEHATEVAGLRATGMTHEQLAARFGVSVRTVRKAPQLAAKLDPAAAQLPRKMPRARWEGSHFREVADLHGQGRTVAQLAEHFDRSESPTRAPSNWPRPKLAVNLPERHRWGRWTETGYEAGGAGLTPRPARTFC
jgi:hypothetical protein